MEDSLVTSILTVSPSYILQEPFSNLSTVTRKIALLSQGQ